MILKTKLTFKEIKDKVENISKEMGLGCEIGESKFKLLTPDFKIEAFLEKDTLRLVKIVERKEDNIYPIFKTFFILGVLVTLIAIVVKDDFFIIEKIIYSIIGVIILVLHSIISKLLSVFFMPFYESESEKKAKRVLLKLKKELS